MALYSCGTCQEAPDDCECHGDEGGEELVERLAARRDGLHLHAVVGVVEQGGVDDAQTLNEACDKILKSVARHRRHVMMKSYTCAVLFGCLNSTVAACRGVHAT